MAVEDYWASSARIANDVAKYGLYPCAKMLAIMATNDSHKANVIAGVSTSLFYTALSWHFLGSEMDGCDQVARRAVAAELGKKPDELSFSDFYDSKNPIVRSRMKLFDKENTERYAVGLLPMLPTAMEYTARKFGPPGMHPAQDEMISGQTRWRDSDSPKPTAHWLEHALHGYNLWDGIVYAGIAALWFKETYGVDKTFIYQSRKEMENNHSLGLKIGPNNIAGLYNRMRNDAGLPMIDNREDRDKLWPMFENIAHRFNRSHRMDLPELTYLMGMGKLDVFAKGADGKELRGADGILVVDPQALQRAHVEIEKVERIGLEGIAEENRRAKAGELQKQENPGTLARIGRDWMDLQFNTYRRIFGKTKSFQEYVSPRDPAEASNSL